MFKLSRRSYDRLTDVDYRLIYLCEQAIKKTKVDFGIAYLGGRRTAEQQNELFKADRSTKDGYTKLSKHQSGQAFDVIPFIKGKVVENDWNYAMICQAILSIADLLELKIRTGSDWDMDGEYLTDQTFKDVGHYEIIL